MEIEELKDKSSNLKKEKQSFLNDTFLWVKIAREAVEQLPNTKFDFEVPKAGKPGIMRTVTRNNPENVNYWRVTHRLHAIS